MITIYNTKIVYKNQSGKRSKIDSKKLLQYVDDAVELDKNVTFKRIMELLTLNAKNVNFFFHRATGGFKIEEFYKDMNKRPSKDGKCDPKIEYLEVYQYPSMWKHKGDESIEFQMVNSFHLVNTKEEHPYGLSFVKLANIKNLKVRIKYNMDFVVCDTTLEVNPENLKPKFSVRSEYMKLYDFIQAIVYEITWHGLPVNRDAIGKELSERVYKIDNKNSEESQTV